MMTFSEKKAIDLTDLLPLYKANKWSAAQKPETLHQALLHSHHLITAWKKDELVGLGNAISDGHLVVYYPHLLVHPDHQGQGIGRKIMAMMKNRYSHLHLQVLTAESTAVDFYKKVGFVRAGATQPMWIYQGNDH